MMTKKQIELYNRIEYEMKYFDKALKDIHLEGQGDCLKNFFLTYHELLHAVFEFKEDIKHDHM